MIEFWISWSHENGDGRSSVPASSFKTAAERLRALGENLCWPAGHMPTRSWETRDGIVS